MVEVKLTALENGPCLLVIDGKKVALCRCGGSNNKPYCDGSHQKINFSAPAKEVKLD